MPAGTLWCLVRIHQAILWMACAGTSLVAFLPPPCRLRCDVAQSRRDNGAATLGRGEEGQARGTFNLSNAHGLHRRDSQAPSRIRSRGAASTTEAAGILESSAIMYFPPTTTLCLHSFETHTSLRSNVYLLYLSPRMSTVRTDGVALYSARFLARDRGAGPFHSLARQKAPPSQAPDPKQPCITSFGHSTTTTTTVQSVRLPASHSNPKHSTLLQGRLPGGNNRCFADGLCKGQSNHAGIFVSGPE